ncbi:MAG: sigma-70 family RNA polymerase sigma factor [Polyangiales bacterium]
MAVITDPDVSAPPCAQPIDAETLYRAHGVFVASFLRHMGTTESDLDDLVQDVFILAHRKGGYQPGPAAPRTWLGSLAIRVVIARRRARARRPPASALVEHIPDGALGPDAVLENRRALDRVQAALAELSVEHRAAFILFEIEGESCESIAAMWGVPTGTVYSRLHHARKRFVEAYGRGTAAGSVKRRSTR